MLPIGTSDLKERPVKRLSPRLEEWQSLATPQLPAHDVLARRLNAVDLKDVLREINSDRGNFVHGRLPLGGS
jgi:hypothetical protein